MGIVYDALRAPFAVFGVPFYGTNGRLERLPCALREELPQLKNFGRRVPGGRIGFRTDAARFTVRVAFERLTVDVGMSIYACQSVAVMRGERTRATFMGLVAPHSYTECTFERTFEKPAEMEEITLWLPRNETVTAVSVELPEGASLEPPTPYRFGKALFYGSSITEGGCSSLPVTNYIALLSRWLDLDFYCMGFSGRAKGERAMAEYLKTLDMSIFVTITIIMRRRWSIFRQRTSRSSRSCARRIPPCLSYSSRAQTLTRPPTPQRGVRSCVRPMRRRGKAATGTFISSMGRACSVRRTALFAPWTARIRTTSASAVWRRRSDRPSSTSSALAEDRARARRGI